MTTQKMCHRGTDHAIGLIHRPSPQPEDSYSVCGYNFGSCTVAITQGRSFPTTTHFCQGSYTAERSSSCYSFTHLHHYFIHHIKFTCSKVQSTQHIPLAKSSFIFRFQCYTELCQTHTSCEKSLLYILHHSQLYSTLLF